MLAFAALAVTFLGASAAPDSLRDALTGATHQHMLMTAPRAARPGDARRAAAIVAAARAVVARYPDAAAAERVGYRKFLPGIELPVEHYVDDAAYAAQDAGHLDPARPAALIFERSGTALRPTGVMYVAAASASDAQLDRAVPLSAARWHRHVDLCFPPDNDIAAAVQPGGRFGFQGSIDTADACRAAGGRWVPALYGWMVHVWPLRSDPWAGDEHAPMPGMVR